MIYMEWESDLYDFSDPEVRLKYVPELGGAIFIHSICFSAPLTITTNGRIRQILFPSKSP